MGKGKGKGGDDDEGGVGVCGFCLGPIIFFFGCWLLFWNEGKYVAVKKAIDEGRSVAVEWKQCDKASADNDGELIWMNCELKNIPTLTDELFPMVNVTSVSLGRDVEGYVWVETTGKESCSKGSTGCKCTTSRQLEEEGEENGARSLKTKKETCSRTTYSYEMNWASSPPDSSGFKDQGEWNSASDMKGYGTPATHNTRTSEGKFRASTGTAIDSGTKKADKVQAGDAFIVPNDRVPGDSASLDVELPGSDKCTGRMLGQTMLRGTGRMLLSNSSSSGTGTPSTGYTTTAMGNTWSCDGQFRTFTGQEQPGDLRVSFTQGTLSEVSMLGKQKADGSFKTIEPWRSESGEDLIVVNSGSVSMKEMFDALQSSNELMLFILRIVGFLVIWGGASCFLQPFVELVDMIPGIGDFLAACGSMIACCVTFFVAAPTALLIIGIAWVFYRPLIGIPMVIIGLIGVIFSCMQGAKMKEEHANRKAGGGGGAGAPMVQTPMGAPMGQPGMMQQQPGMMQQQPGMMPMGQAMPMGQPMGQPMMQQQQMQQVAVDTDGDGIADGVMLVPVQQQPGMMPMQQ